MAARLHAEHEERRAHLALGEHVEDPRGVLRVGAVVERERDHGASLSAATVIVNTVSFRAHELGLLA